MQHQEARVQVVSSCRGLQKREKELSYVCGQSIARLSGAVVGMAGKDVTGLCGYPIRISLSRKTKRLTSALEREIDDMVEGIREKVKGIGEGWEIKKKKDDVHHP